MFFNRVYIARGVVISSFDTTKITETKVDTFHDKIRVFVEGSLKLSKGFQPVYINFNLPKRFMFHQRSPNYLHVTELSVIVGYKKRIISKIYQAESLNSTIGRFTLSPCRKSIHVTARKLAILSEM
jgi:recombinational DNA repair protein (RecF pathway)